MKRFVPLSSLFLLLLLLSTVFHRQLAAAYYSQATDKAQRAQSGQNVDYVGHLGGITEAVFVAGNYAYIGEGPRLTILDITTPTSPTVVGKSAPMPDIVRDVYVSGNYAYVADDYEGLRIVDISTPTSPTEVGACHATRSIQQPTLRFHARRVGQSHRYGP